jgi:hypothetical protein
MEVVRLDIEVAGRPEHSTFAVVDLGGGEVFLGYDWLQEANPTIDWAAGRLIFKSEILYSDLNPTQEEELPDEFGIGRLILQVDRIDPTPTDQVFVYVLGWTIDEEDGLRLHVVSTPAQQLAEEDLRHRVTAVVKLPAAYADFHDVFNKHEFDTLPPTQDLGSCDRVGRGG